MKLFLLTSEVLSGHDTFDSMIVRAETEERAKEITLAKEHDFSWPSKAEDLEALEIGTVTEGQLDATQEGVVLASFNAG